MCYFRNKKIYAPVLKPLEIRTARGRSFPRLRVVPTMDMWRREVLSVLLCESRVRS